MSRFGSTGAMIPNPIVSISTVSRTNSTGLRPEPAAVTAFDARSSTSGLERFGLRCPAWLLGDRKGGALLDVGEEVVALVVDHDERREVLDPDLPDRFHAELGVLEDLDLGDAVLGQPRSRPADRAEVEATILLAGGRDLRRAVALGQRDQAAARGLQLVDVAVHAP